MMKLVRRTKVLRRRLLRWTEGAVVEAEAAALRSSGRRNAASILEDIAMKSGLGKPSSGTKKLGALTLDTFRTVRKADAQKRWLAHSELWNIASVMRRLDAVLRSLLRHAGIRTSALGIELGQGFDSRKSLASSRSAGSSAFAEDAMEKAVAEAFDMGGEAAALISRSLYHSAHALDGFDHLEAVGLGPDSFSAKEAEDDHNLPSISRIAQSPDGPRTMAAPIVDSDLLCEVSAP